MKDGVWDVAVVGAGAAGLMAAVTARRGGLNVLLLDGKEKIGAKILISGGTRCNLTNRNVTDRDFQGEARNQFHAVLKSFSSEETVRFFKSLGLSVVEEEGGKYFPSTHSGRTVLEAFLREIRKSGIHLETPRKVAWISWRDPFFEISGQGFSYTARSVILSTGGLSYPATGSDGTGYGLAKAFGHSVIPTIPSLTPLETNDPDWKSLSGISLPVRLSLLAGQKKMAEYEGPMLFTHFGFSGPAALNISRHWIRSKDGPSVSLNANLLPDSSPDALRHNLLKARQGALSKTVKQFLSSFGLPERLAETVLKKAGLPILVKLSGLEKEQRENMIRLLFRCPLDVIGALGYAKAEVTAGGVDLREIDRQSMESKFRPGLFLAGEILDVDGRIGGFNFQWAWSSGVTAARGVLRKLRPGLSARQALGFP